MLFEATPILVLVTPNNNGIYRERKNKNKPTRVNNCQCMYKAQRSLCFRSMRSGAFVTPSILQRYPTHQSAACCQSQLLLDSLPAVGGGRNVSPSTNSWTSMVSCGRLG